MRPMTAALLLVVALCSRMYITNWWASYQPKTPTFDLGKWWGVGTRPEKEDDTIRPFKIEFNDTMIKDLKQRLRNRRRFTKSLEGMQSYYGMNSDYFERVLKYWIEKYDFKRRAELLNKFNHYKTRIQGLDIHFIRATPEEKPGLQVLPLLMLHGWPSSSKEFVKVIPMLTTPRAGFDFVFEIIAADLPGFGFSELAKLGPEDLRDDALERMGGIYELNKYSPAPTRTHVTKATNKPDLNPVQMAIIMRNLMLRLGFEKFYIQAGDWGSQCASHLATFFPKNVLGFHSNMPISSRPISLVKLLIGSFFPRLIDSGRPERVYPLVKHLHYIIKESGYFHLQATKPDTLGFALSDSPAGLAAYMMEKIAICCNRDQLDTPHGGLEGIDIDDVLDTVTITWMNECIVTSMRIYAEASASSETYAAHNKPTEVPTAAIKFLYEVMYQPDWLLRDKYHNLVRSTIVDYGGHFAALQNPKELAEDVFAAAAEFIKFHNSRK